jgi:phage-related protein
MRDVEFYKTPSGSSPIEEFLDSLDARQAQKVTWVLELIEELERIPQQYFKKLSGSDEIWEVRAKAGKETFRLLGFMKSAKLVILVHAFKKKSQQIRKTDIQLAEKRKKEYLSR